MDFELRARVNHPFRDGRLSESVKRIPSPEQTVQSRFKAHRYGLVRRYRLR